MCALSRSSETLYGTPEEEEVDEKFSILVFKDFVGELNLGKKQSLYVK